MRHRPFLRQIWALGAGPIPTIPFRAPVFLPILCFSILCFSLLSFSLVGGGCSSSDADVSFTPAPRLQALHVEMRDGVRIAIDVWVPEGLEEDDTVPTLMRMTRYWRADDVVAADGGNLTADANFERADAINQAGYAYVIVDARGTGASFGTRAYETTEDEVRDYGEIADWIVAQPWSNGRIGSFGVSYDGTTAEMLAVNQHPAVRAVAPLYPDFNAFDHLVYPGNVFLEFFTDEWGAAVSRMDNDDICGLTGNVEEEACQQVKARVRGVKPVDSDPDRTLVAAAVVDHARNARVADAARSLEFKDDPFGDGPRFVDRLSSPAWKRKQIEASGAAIFSRVGWLDAATVAGALSRFNTFSNPQRVVIGALSHGGGHDTDPYRSPDAQPDPSEEEQFVNLFAFFDPLLAGEAEPTSVTSEITYVTLGSGEWRTTSVWPPQGFDQRTFYLAANGTLNEEVANGPGSDRYEVDYTATTGLTNRWHTNIGGGDVVYPDRRKEDEKLLTYTSAPLERDSEITGHPLVTLYVRSSTEDPAFFAYLETVAPDGTVTYVTEGQLRAISRKVADTPPPYWHAGPYRTFLREDAEPMPIGEVEEITFDLWATSVHIPAGHRIRVALAGADAGNFARYPRGGESATWTIERGSDHPSRIVLPMRGE